MKKTESGKDKKENADCPFCGEIDLFYFEMIGHLRNWCPMKPKPFAKCKFKLNEKRGPSK